MYEIKQKISMSQKIVKKDEDYGFYSGADLETAIKISKLKTLIKAGYLPSDNEMVTFMLLYLEQRRKAFMGSMSTELTKLGFILGDERVFRSATK